MNSAERILDGLVLRRLTAIKKAVEHKWEKGQPGKDTGRCLGMIVEDLSAAPLTEAIYKAFERDPVLLERTEEQHRKRTSFYPALPCSRTVWFNDHPATTREDILALIERTKTKLQ